MRNSIVKRIERAWGLLRHRHALQSATVYDSALAKTTHGTVWSKAFICGMADVYPPRTSSNFRELVVSMDHYEREIQRSNKPVTAVYVVGSHVREFVETIFPRITQRIAIVTGNSTDAVPVSVLGLEENARRFLDDDRLVGAWVQNLDIEHEKAVPIPLGLDFHNLHANKWGPWHDLEETLTPNQQEQQLHTIAGQALAFELRAPEVFTHFTVGTQRAVRSEWLSYLQEQSFAQAPEGTIERSMLWRAMSRFQFVASPPGAGMDCHRTWEALALGSVPIVQRFAPMATMYDDLPIWQVDHVSEITQESLQSKAAEVNRNLQDGLYDFRKLTIGWWREQMQRRTAL